MPRIGTPYVKAPFAWRALRWLIPIGLSAIALLVFMYPPQTFGADLLARNRIVVPAGPFSLTHREPAGMVILRFLTWSVIPTMVFYRLVIAVGERCWIKRPVYGALIAISVIALVPPFIDHLLVKRTLDNLDKVSFVPELQGKVVQIESQGDSMAFCSDYCLKLLYGHNARKVVVRNTVYDKPQADFDPIVGFRLGKPPKCNTVIRYRDQFPDNGPSAVERAIGQIASGNCIVQEPADLEQVKLVFNPRMYIPWFDAEHREYIWPSSFSTYGVNHAWLFVLDARSPSSSENLVRLSGSLSMIAMNYPTALFVGDTGWFSSSIYNRKHSEPDIIGSKLAAIGMNSDKPSDIGLKRTERLLMDAIRNPKLAPENHQLQLASQYVRLVANREPEKRVLQNLAEIIVDLRAPIQALTPLQKEISRPGNEVLVDALMARLLEMPLDSGSEIGLVARIIIRQSDQQTWSYVLPKVRLLNHDLERLSHASELLKVYEFGSAADVDELSDLYRQITEDHKRHRLTEPILNALCKVAAKNNKLLSPDVKTQCPLLRPKRTLKLGSINRNGATTTTNHILQTARLPI